MHYDEFWSKREELFIGVDRSTAEFAMLLVEQDLTKRLTARAALDHPYFDDLRTGKTKEL